MRRLASMIKATSRGVGICLVGRVAGSMGGGAWLAVAVAFAGCTMQSFDYEATVAFSPSSETVRLNHQAVAPGAVWAASYSSFADALRDPSIVEIGDQAVAIGPNACQSACRSCDFDRASLTFTFSGDALEVAGTCGAGERSFVVHVQEPRPR